MNAPCAGSLPDQAAMAGLAARRALPEQAADFERTGGIVRRVLLESAPAFAPAYVPGLIAGAWRALLLACLLFAGGSVLANDAQLILVAGEVTLQRTPAGQPVRTSVPVTGTRVQSGDALVTGATGRVQIRFSDGSLVSLQPKSEFRIDDYQFDMDRQRGFFSLVRGALRTISGAVGKRDPDDYRMTTPTATIGIRGTEFLVEETICTPACHPGRTAGLRVSVSAGGVVVFNAAGSIEVPAGGATYVASPASAPVPSSERPTMSTAPASFDPATPAAGIRLAGLTQEAAGAGSQALDRAEGVPPALRDQWSTGSAMIGRGRLTAQAQVLASAASGSAAAAVPPGATSRAVPPKATRGEAPQSSLVRRENPGATSSSSSATAPTDELDDESGDESDEHSLDDFAQAPSGNAALPFLAIDFNRPTASLGTPAQDGSNGAGQKEPANDTITIVALSPSGDGTMTAPLNGSSGTNAQRDAVGLPVAIVSTGICRVANQCTPAAGDGGLAGTGGGGDTGGTIDTGIGGTAGGGDTGGSDTGGDTGSGDIGGGDSGGGDSGSGDTGDGDTDGDDTGGSDTGGGDTGGDTGGGTPVLTPGPNSGERVAVRTLQSPWFDLHLSAASARVTLDADYRLESIGYCPNILCLSRGTAQVAEAGHNADISWGRWVNGNARVTVLGFFREDRAVGSNNGVHYLVGVPTVTMPTTGSAYYAIGGATSPTFASGDVTPGVFTGQGLVQFNSGQDTRIGFKGDMVFGSGERYHLFSNGARADDTGRLVEIGATQIRMTGRTTFRGNIGVVSQGNADRLGCGGSNCQANLEGGFYGPEAARMGVGYSVGRTNGVGDTINGVAVLNRERP